LSGVSGTTAPRSPVRHGPLPFVAALPFVAGLPAADGGAGGFSRMWARPTCGPSVRCSDRVSAACTSVTSSTSLARVTVT
jgi:hypothetical protein